MGFVYVLKTANNGVKIGISDFPEERIKQISYIIKSDILLRYVSEEISNHRDIERDILAHFDNKKISGEWVSESFESVVEFTKRTISKKGTNSPLDRMCNKTSAQVMVNPELHKQFADLAGFLNPGLKRTDARDKLLDEAMKDRIKKEAGKK